jgi:DNA excision repair protein ERCC-4
LIATVLRGLGLERLFLSHLHLYNDARYTVLVLNTHEEDEVTSASRAASNTLGLLALDSFLQHYFLDRLKEMNGSFPPKLLNHCVQGKDREKIYMTGGVQFITARVLMVDLLTERVPIDKIAGIVVYRAHE